MKINTGIFHFLNDLKDNNNKTWFDSKKDHYKKLKSDFEDFINNLITELRALDNQLEPIEAKDCIFRVYRDIRFSKDKTPYKTHFGAYITNGGRKSVFPGYYLHIEPGNSFIAGGMHNPPPDILKSVRTFIYDNVQEFRNIIEKDSFKKFFGDLPGNKLKMVPKGFPKDFEWIDLLKYKSYAVWHQTDDDTMMDGAADKHILHVAEELLPLNIYMRKAIGN